MKLNFNLLIILVFCLVFAIVFWPTLYRYEKSDSSVIRINRFTGNAQALGSEEWKELAPEVKSTTLDPYGNNPFSSNEELKNIQGNAGLTGYGYFIGDLYNGTSDLLNEISFEITAKKNKKILWKRIYSQKFSNFSPLSSQKVAIAVAGDEASLTTEWRVYSASRK